MNQQVTTSIKYKYELMSGDTLILSTSNLDQIVSKLKTIGKINTNSEDFVGTMIAIKTSLPGATLIEPNVCGTELTLYRKRI